jgi:hypothetical protein
MMTNKEIKVLREELAYEIGRQVRFDYRTSAATQRHCNLRLVDDIAKELIIARDSGLIDEIVDLDLLVENKLLGLDLL